MRKLSFRLILWDVVTYCKCLIYLFVFKRKVHYLLKTWLQSCRLTCITWKTIWCEDGKCANQNKQNMHIYRKILTATFALRFLFSVRIVNAFLIDTFLFHTLLITQDSALSWNLNRLDTHHSRLCIELKLEQIRYLMHILIHGSNHSRRSSFANIKNVTNFGEHWLPFPIWVIL